MPNKEMNRSQIVDAKAPPVVTQHATSKPVPSTTKAVVNKCAKETVMSPGPPPSIEEESSELLGSLTTEQQQRTSARVIKKLRLEPPGDKRGKKDGADDLQECETPIKIDDKELKFPTVKQRMPKALWSTDEKNYFFEALNEYGKDFDAITAYICAKMKKKGMPDNLKTKTQVSHFYYRTWHKLSKHVHFDENVKKVAQELYALINYGELRKKLSSVPEKTCARLGEMVRCGSMAVRARGRTVRVRTPMCRALRSLNQITEVSCGLRLCSVVCVLRARGAADWARVLRAAHNPRAATALAPRQALATVLRALQRRWGGTEPSKLSETLEDNQKETEEYDVPVCERDRELEDHLELETDRIILQEQKSSKKLALHLGPRPGAEIHLPVVSASEQLSSHKICFSSYLERMGSQRDKDGASKIRTPKRARKDSTTDKDKESDPKRIKPDDLDKLVNIEETAIDGIELMASYKTHEEEKPSTEDEKDRELPEEDGDRELPERDSTSERDKDTERDTDKEMLERDKDMSEKEKDSFSEMEDDEKYNKSDTDNESDHGKEKTGKDTKFKNLKVKFRIRPKKRGGSIYTLVMDPEEGKDKSEGPKEDEKPDIDVDMALRQIRKGWSVYDAGELTIGDLYLMFGSRSKLELDYWWAEPTPPLPQPKSSPTQKLSEDKKTDKTEDKKDKIDADKKIDKTEEKKPDKMDDKKSDKDSSVEDEKERARESDNDILSPKHVFSQDSNDGMSGDERKSEQLLSPEHKSSSSSLKLVSKLINRPTAASTHNNGFTQMSDRLRRLLALAGNPHVGSAHARCDVHVCARKQIQLPQKSPLQSVPDPAVFRQPPPLAPKPDTHNGRGMLSMDGLPKWRRGRTARAKHVVVQRLLPLLPKLPTHNPNPVKVPNTPPAPPRILPKPPHTSTSDLSFFYVLSESNGQFFFHDGDRRIPITMAPGNGAEHTSDGDESEDPDKKEDVKLEVPSSSDSKEQREPDPGIELETKTEPLSDVKPDRDDPEGAPSLTLSPSRLLQEGVCWLDAADFSLSSFLSHLDARPQPDLAVDSQLQSLMAESSVDYVAKFADLAAEVTKEADPPPDKLN